MLFCGVSVEKPVVRGGGSMYVSRSLANGPSDSTSKMDRRSDWARTAKMPQSRARRNMTSLAILRSVSALLVSRLPPDVPKIHNEAGVVLPSHAGPYEEGGDLVLICVVTGAYNMSD
uniref:Uncharacterized protein n=1 Tax=Anopheles christyi TaxID=43041 RepID=A0A182K4G5_9DIPT